MSSKNDVFNLDDNNNNRTRKLSESLKNQQKFFTNYFDSQQPQLFDTDEISVIIGTDEAGRGPLAGPVCAACVVLPSDFPFGILNDSKKLTEKQRKSAEFVIKGLAIAWSVAWSTPAEIDNFNILNASLLAMKRAYLLITEKLKSIGIKPQLLLVDGNKCPDVDISCKAIIRGDSKIYEIMAASILAKTARDRLMICADKRWQNYGFAKHKGYPTKQHVLAIQKFGLTPIHRKSFKIPSYSSK